MQAKNRCEIGVGKIGIPRKGVGYFVRVAWNPFAGESRFRPDQYLCQFFDPMKWAVFASLMRELLYNNPPQRQTNDNIGVVHFSCKSETQPSLESWSPEVLKS
jgi:hypothetical protein